VVKAGRVKLTWRSQVGANHIPIPHPTNLALFGHKITPYRFNQGAHTIAGGSSRSRGLSPRPFTLTTAYVYPVGLRNRTHYSCPHSVYSATGLGVATGRQNAFSVLPQFRPHQWLKWGGRGAQSPPALIWAPCNSMSPQIESIKCYFMPK